MSGPNRTTPRERMRALCTELEGLAAGLDRPLSFMEVCGTHTVNACRSGVHSLMPEAIRLVSGPGCPVCVTAQRYIDALIRLGFEEDCILCTYGDMLRVAGAGGSLELARSEGADVRVVTSSMEAVAIAKAEPDREVVFAAVGFETTAPASAAAVLAAESRGLENFSILACHKLVMPAMRMLLEDPETRIDGFLCPGHVSVVLGSEVYRPVVREYGKSCVVTGFEALQIMGGILELTKSVVDGEARLVNGYLDVVDETGNAKARELIDRVFVEGPAAWRALGVLDASGLDLRPEYRSFDAYERFGVQLGEDHDPPGCRCGEVISGKCLPDDCKLFGTVCTPIYPVGPCMVSSEGSCQAWFKYRRNEKKRAVALGQAR